MGNIFPILDFGTGNVSTDILSLSMTIYIYIRISIYIMNLKKDLSSRGVNCGNPVSALINCCVQLNMCVYALLPIVSFRMMFLSSY